MCHIKTLSLIGNSINQNCDEVLRSTEKDWKIVHLQFSNWKGGAGPDSYGYFFVIS
jgi:hypothetical protein